MSVKELRAAVRELRAEAQAKDAVLSKRAAQVDELETKLAHIKTLPQDEISRQVQEEAAKHFFDAHGALTGNFTAAVEMIIGTGIGPQPLAVAAGMIAQLQADLNALRDRFAIPDVAPAMVPEWLSQIEG